MEEKIIYLEDVKHEKERKERYETRKPLIRAMLLYEEKYTLNELVYDFNGVLMAMKERRDN